MWQGLLNKVFKIREKVALNLGKEDEEKPFLEHLDDLRKMLVRMLTTLVVSTIGTFCFYKKLFSLIMAPLHIAGIAKTQEEAEKMLQTIKLQEGFMTAVNVSLIAAVIIAFPLLMIFLLQFVLPGLKASEKKVLWPAMAVGAGLFLTGVFFSYLIVLPRAIQFFHSFSTDLGLGIMWTLGEYITFSTRFILIFGISFELPVVVMALVKLDFLSYKVMKTTRKHALIGIAIFSAVVTPTQDVLTLLLLAGPLYVLYEICIWLAYFIEKKERQAYPEFYAERDKDEADLEKEMKDDWDTEDYNPWDQSGEIKDDEDDNFEGGRKTKTKEPPPPATDSPDSSEAEAAPPINPETGAPAAEPEPEKPTEPDTEKPADSEARNQD